MYLTEAYLQEAFGALEVAALCPASGATSAADVLARVIQQATAETETALQNGGYASAVPASIYTSLAAADGTAPTSTQCPAAISLLAFGAWIELAHGRRTIQIPEQYAAYVRKLDQVRSGRMELPGITKSVSRTVGGVSSTDTTSDSCNSRPQIFGRKAFADGGF